MSPSLLEPLTEKGIPIGESRSHPVTDGRTSRSYRDRRLWLRLAALLAVMTVSHFCSPKWLWDHLSSSGAPKSHGGLETNGHESTLAGDGIWDLLVSSENPIWLPCYPNRLCAKLSVPLDYSDPSGPKASVALIKVPAKVPRSSENYRGPVLFNPGGPGGSGVDFILRSGDSFAKLLGDEYDIVGFDPRGVGRTTPAVDIFNHLSERASFMVRTTQDPLINQTENALARLHSRAAVVGSLGEQRAEHAAQYVSTAIVSRDMLSITRAHGRERLQYWGFSYGSVLGITFAAMFPDNVERLIVDGVCDTENYYEAQWSNNLRDTEKTLRAFTEGCAQADPKECALHAKSAAGVKARLDAIFESLKRQPLPVISLESSGGTYGLVDYKLARMLVFIYLYRPLIKTPHYSAAALATALAAAEQGDGRPILDLVNAIGLEPSFTCDCPRVPWQRVSHEEATYAIACSDGDVVEDTLDELWEHYEGMAKDSNFADMWPHRAMCSGWKIRPKERFRGPFIGNTSFPLLLIGNTADPVTPLWNAEKMSKGFKDAVVLTQDSPGHCSLSATSLCTAKHVREYFRNGVVPKADTVCHVEERVFGVDANIDEASLDTEHLGILRAVRELNANFVVPRLGFPGFV